MDTIERRDLEAHGEWEPIESSWECPGKTADPETAAALARVLAIRRDGSAVFHAVAEQGGVLVRSQVTKAWESSWPGTRATRERLAPNVEARCFFDEVVQGQRDEVREHPQ